MKTLLHEDIPSLIKSGAIRIITKDNTELADMDVAAEPSDLEVDLESPRKKDGDNCEADNDCLSDNCVYEALLGRKICKSYFEEDSSS